MTSSTYQTGGVDNDIDDLKTFTPENHSKLFLF